MYAPFVLGVLAVILAVRRARRVEAAGRHARTAVPMALQALRASHEIAFALRRLQALGSVVASAVADRLQRVPRARFAAECMTRGQWRHGIGTLEHRCPLPSLLAYSALLAGVLGTALGMIGAMGAVTCETPDTRWIMQMVGFSQALNCAAFGILIALACLTVDALIDARRERLRADADHALALLRIEVALLRPHLSYFGKRILDPRATYRGA